MVGLLECSEMQKRRGLRDFKLRSTGHHQEDFYM